MADQPRSWRWLLRGIALGIVLGAVAGSVMTLTSKSERNIHYMRNVVGDVILHYMAVQAVLPDAFDEALARYPKTLPNRGDYRGRPFHYERQSPTSFSCTAMVGTGGMMPAEATTLYFAGLRRQAGIRTVWNCEVFEWYLIRARASAIHSLTNFLVWLTSS
jgi:hypothetical protein